MNDEPKQIVLGTFEPGVTHLVIPAAVIRPAEAILDAERKRREAEAAKAKLQVLQAARNRGRLKRAMTAVFGHRRRGR